MSTYIGMGNENYKKNQEVEKESLYTKVATLEKEVDTEKSAKEEALTKVATLEKEVAELKKNKKKENE